MQYHTGDTVPSGHANFRFNVADLDFNSTGFAWLIVTNGQTKAYFRGTGDVNGDPGYDFLVSVTDASPDTFRMQVTEHATGNVIYDNQNGAPDDATAVQPVLTGSVQIH